MRGAHRGDATRRALLEAAARVFGAVGFDKAGVSEIASAAGTSVGGLYHHFGGKAELHRALFDEFQRRQQIRTREAVDRARAEGESDPTRLMVLATHAYLNGCIDDRDAARLFYCEDGPPGFERELRERLWEWTDRNVALYRKADEPVDQALLMVVSGTGVLVVTQLVSEPDRARAERLGDEVLAVLQRLVPPRPHSSDQHPIESSGEEGRTAQ